MNVVDISHLSFGPQPVFNPRDEKFYIYDQFSHEFGDKSSDVYREGIQNVAPFTIIVPLVQSMGEKLKTFYDENGFSGYLGGYRRVREDDFDNVSLFFSDVSEMMLFKLKFDHEQ
jgi:hypothetical protein